MSGKALAKKSKNTWVFQVFAEHMPVKSGLGPGRTPPLEKFCFQAL